MNPQGKPFGLRRMQKALLSHASASLEENLYRVLRESSDYFAEAVRDDDLSLVLLELI